MYNSVGLTIPERHFPNIVAYLNHLGNRYCIRHSQDMMTYLIEKLMTYVPGWVVWVGNWRSGRNLVRVDGSLFVER